MSSENNLAAEALSLVETAQTKSNFNIIDFAKGRSYPQETISAFLDIESAYELNKINETLRELQDPAKLESLEARANELAVKVIASKITFHMRGISQAIIERVTTETDEKYPPERDHMGQIVQDAGWIRDWTASLIAANLVRIENADGQVDERVFTMDEVTTMRHHFPKQVWDVLVDTMQKLTLATAYFEGLTDAGFLPKS
jgi:hypothetical protein